MRLTQLKYDKVAILLSFLTLALERDSQRISIMITTTSLLIMLPRLLSLGKFCLISHFPFSTNQLISAITKTQLANYLPYLSK